MRENEPVLLVLSVCDGEIILEKGEILCEKCHICPLCCKPRPARPGGHLCLQCALLIPWLCTREWGRGLPGRAGRDRGWI